MKIRIRKYRCVHCGKALLRRSDKLWVKSYCESTQRTVHLQLVNKSLKLKER